MNKHILLVEDNSSDEKLTRRAFQKAGIANEIIAVRDGSDALDYLFCSGRHADRDSASGPGLVLLDLSLPRISGLDVLKRVRSDERIKLLPIVVLTSSKEEEDVIRSYEFGANAYVRKPLSFIEFAEAARALGMFWLLLNVTPERKGT